MSKVEALILVDTLGGEFEASIEVFEEPAERTICITIDDEPQSFHSANLGWEEAKALRDWLNEALKDD